MDSCVTMPLNFSGLLFSDHGSNFHRSTIRPHQYHKSEEAYRQEWIFPSRIGPTSAIVFPFSTFKLIFFSTWSTVATHISERNILYSISFPKLFIAFAFALSVMMTQHLKFYWCVRWKPFRAVRCSMPAWWIFDGGMIWEKTARYATNSAGFNDPPELSITNFPPIYMITSWSLFQ